MLMYYFKSEEKTGKQKSTNKIKKKIVEVLRLWESNHSLSLVRKKH